MACGGFRTVFVVPFSCILISKVVDFWSCSEDERQRRSIRCVCNNSWGFPPTVTGLFKVGNKYSRQSACTTITMADRSGNWLSYCKTALNREPTGTHKVLYNPVEMFRCWSVRWEIPADFLSRWCPHQPSWRSFIPQKKRKQKYECSPCRGNGFTVHSRKRTSVNRKIQENYRWVVFPPWQLN